MNQAMASASTSKAGPARGPEKDFGEKMIELARRIDWMLAMGQKPKNIGEFAKCLKQMLDRADKEACRPHALVLLVAANGAHKAGWLDGAEKSVAWSTKVWGLETTANLPAEPRQEEPQDDSTYVREMLQMLYPWYELSKLLVAQHTDGGECCVLACDFPFIDKLRPEESIFVFTCRIGVTTEVLLPPKQASILINGAPVVHRTTTHDTAKSALPPTDVTKLVQAGTNLLQAIGTFKGPHAIFVATLRPAIFTPGPLEEIAETLAALQDDDVSVEGPYKVSLRDPISLQRIAEPVRGASCVHRQCFDLKTFLAHNHAVPAWKCPLCEGPAALADLRKDTFTAKVLAATPNDTEDIEILPGGGWRVLDDNSQEGTEAYKIHPADVIELDDDGELEIPERTRRTEQPAKGVFEGRGVANTQVDTKPDLSALLQHAESDVLNHFVSPSCHNPSPNPNSNPNLTSNLNPNPSLDSYPHPSLSAPAPPPHAEHPLTNAFSSQVAVGAHATTRQVTETSSPTQDLRLARGRATVEATGLASIAGLVDRPRMRRAIRRASEPQSMRVPTHGMYGAGTMSLQQQAVASSMWSPSMAEAIPPAPPFRNTPDYGYIYTQVTGAPVPSGPVAWRSTAPIVAGVPVVNAIQYGASLVATSSGLAGSQHPNNDPRHSHGYLYHR